MPATRTQAPHPLTGRTVKAVRKLHHGDISGRERPGLVDAIEFDDGTVLIGGQDEQFLGLGWLYARNPKTQAWEPVEAPEETL